MERSRSHVAAVFSRNVNFLIVYTFKETEEANAVFVDDVVVVIDDGGNATYNFASGFSQEELHGCMLIERILLGIEEFLTIHDQWWDEVLIALVKIPLTLYEAVDVG